MRKTGVFWLILTLLMVAGRAGAVSLGEAVVKTLTVGAVVTAVAEPADKAINTLTMNRNVPPGVSTKVVPVVSVGEKGYVGAVQVAGSRELVGRTKAVLQVETSWSNQQFRIKLLMPVDSVNPVGANRVRGIGASALLDIAISDNAYLLPRSVGWNTGDVLKGAAIGVAVNEFGPQLNSFINSVFQNQGALPAGATKVVPYLSVGEKAYLGMIQVAGPQEQVDKVRAVWQYEDLFDRGRVRLRVLVPSDSLNPLRIGRVPGVGCTAVIDAMVLRAREQERKPQEYRYFERAGIFLGPGEDPHYRPPGWDQGRKVGWSLHGDPTTPPGLSRSGPPGRGAQHQERNRRGRGR